MITDKQVEAAMLALYGTDAMDSDREPIRRALEAAEAVMWEPIETAPKDGTKILTVFPFSSGQFHVAWFFDDRHAKKPRPYWRSMNLGVFECRAYQPTHWLPLPEPPKENKP